MAEGKDGCNCVKRGERRSQFERKYGIYRKVKVMIVRKMVRME